MKKDLIRFGSIIMVFLLVFAFSPYMRQEDNTFSLLLGIIRLQLTETEAAKYDSNESQIYYVTRTSSGIGPVLEVLESKGYEYSDQLGAAHFFSKDSDNKYSLIVGSRMFSKKYRIWIVPISYDDK